LAEPVATENLRAETISEFSALANNSANNGKTSDAAQPGWAG
jgi:hypothetical protein